MNTKECRFCELAVTNSTVDQLCGKEIILTNSTFST